MENSAPLHEPVVLVAEDHPVNRKIAGLLLTSMGFRVLIAEDGQAAVQTYTEQKPAAILMDLMMPIMDGFQASKAIRDLEFGCGHHTPIIACSALDKENIRQECISCGIDDYIGKPYSRQLLADKLECWLPIKIIMKPVTQGLTAMPSSAPIDRQQLRFLYGLEQLDDVLSMFMSVTEALLAQLDTAIQSHDPESVRKIAFEIRSGSHAVDARDLAKLCNDLEQIGNNWSDVMKTYSALSLAFGKVRDFMHTKHLPADESAGLLPGLGGPGGRRIS